MPNEHAAEQKGLISGNDNRGWYMTPVRLGTAESHVTVSLSRFPGRDLLLVQEERNKWLTNPSTGESDFSRMSSHPQCGNTYVLHKSHNIPRNRPSVPSALAVSDVSCFDVRTTLAR